MGITKLGKAGSLSNSTRIDAASLIAVQLSADGKRLHLKLRDATGETVSLTLPSNCLNQVLTAMPRTVETDAVHPLDTWTMGLAENGEDLVLTLRTSEGRAVSFMTRPSQVQGMATIATYGRGQRTTAKTLH